MIQVICCSSLLSAGWGFKQGFYHNLAPECSVYSGALKIEKLKAPLIPGPRGPWIQITGALHNLTVPREGARQQFASDTCRISRKLLPELVEETTERAGRVY